MPASSSVLQAAAAPPIRAYTLGRFALMVGDRPPAFGPKVPRRALELLKALVALGGRCVCEWKLCDALWPDAEADAARQNLKATLHRLRKLVGAQAVQLRGGQLSLSPQCSVDAWEFERHVNAALDLPLGSSATALLPPVERALALYRGPFLDGEASGFAQRTRERLRGKLVRAVLRAAQASVTDGEPARGMALLQRAIDLEPLEEALYEPLMRLWLGAARPIEAMKAHAQLVVHLREGAGLRPSCVLDALRDEAVRAAGLGTTAMSA